MNQFQIVLQVGDSVIFHARSNFPLSEFHFILYSHGQIVTSQRIRSNSGSRLVTFDAMATSEMTPSAKGMIWMADRDGRVVSAETTLVVGSQDKKAVSSSFTYLPITKMGKLPKFTNFVISSHLTINGSKVERGIAALSHLRYTRKHSGS